jgi:hypothetical protein
MIKLLLRFDTESRELELADTSITLGRSSENAIALSDKKTSRKHARIEKTDQGYRISDLGSGNGTRVNGREVDSVLLTKGDEVKIGLTTLYVLDFDGPVPAVAAPAAVVPVAIEVAAPIPAAPVAAPAPQKVEAAAPAATPENARPKITRRSTYVPRGSSGGKVVAAALTLIIVGSVAYAGYVYLPQMQLGGGKPSVAVEKKVDPAAKERADALAAIRTKVGSSTPMTEEVVREANDMAAKHGTAEPQFEAVASQARLKWADQLGKMTFDQVQQLVTSALRERRYGDATEALKPLANGADSKRVAELMTRVDTEAKGEFGSVDKFGKDLVAREQYNLAVEHYRANAPRFRGTIYYKTLSNNVESLQELAAEKEKLASRPKEGPKPAEIEIAKVTPKETPEPPKEEPKETPKETPKPAMPADTKKPVMEAPKPKEMPKETPKPKEPEKPKEMPKPPEKPKDPVTVKAFKKPDVLCNCKKVVKGVYCIKCDRTLEPDDLRKNLCKRCEEPPKKVDICVKKYFTVDGHPEKVSDKPITFEGKVYDIPQEDRARILHYCTTCEDVADTATELKHKPDCSNKNTVVKVCSKSGIGPHLPDNK